MHQKVFGNVKKKNKNKKKAGLATIFESLFILHLDKSVYISHSNGQIPELARDDWLESLLAEEMNVTVVVNHLLLLRLHWDMCL